MKFSPYREIRKNYNKNYQPFFNKIMLLDQRIPVHSVCNVYTVNILKLLYAAETGHVCLYILLGKVRTLLERYCDSLNE